MGSYNEPSPGDYSPPPDEIPVDQGPAPGPSAPSGGATDLNALYQQYLGRNVDPSGAATFAGQDANAVIQGILGSQEYANIAAAGGGGGGGIPQGAIAALGGMDTAPAWLPPAQYAQYGFNAQGKRDKEEGLATFLQTKTPEGVPAAPTGFTFAGSNNRGGSDDSMGTKVHSYNDAKGGTLTIDEYGNTQYTPGNQWYEEQYAKHPDAIRSGYRNQQYLARGPLDQTVDVPGIGPVSLNEAFIQENVINPTTKQLYKDKGGNYVPVYREPSGGDGFNNVMEQLINTGFMVAGTAIGGPLGAAGTAAFISAMNDAKTQDILKNAAIAGGTAFLGGEILGDGNQSLFGPLGDSLSMDAATLADLELGNAMTRMANVGPEAGLTTLESNLNPEISIEPTSGLPTLEANVITPDTSAATNTLTQTYPDINVGPPIEPTALTPLEIQAAQLPMDTMLPPGTISASTTGGSYLSPSSSPDVLIETAKINAKNGINKWWQVTGIPSVDAGIRQAVFGSAMGGATSGIMGGSVGKGAMYGGIAGGITGAGGEYLGGKFFPDGFNPTSNNIANAGIRSGLYGGANSAIAAKLAGGDPGKAAIIGSLISGIAGSGLQAVDDYYAKQYRLPGEPDRLPSTDSMIKNANKVIDRDITANNTPPELQPYSDKFKFSAPPNRITGPDGMILDTGMPGMTPDQTYFGQNLNNLNAPSNPYRNATFDENGNFVSFSSNQYETGMNPAIRNQLTTSDPSLRYSGPAGGTASLNPNLNYINEGVANTVQALSDASGITVDPMIFDAVGSLSAKDALELDKAITNAEEIGVPYYDIIKDLVIPFLPFVVNPPGKNQKPTDSSPSSPTKKTPKVPKRAGGKGNFDNYLLKNKVYAGNVYTPEATGFQSVLKEGGEVQHFDIGGSVSNSFSNLFKPVEQNIIQPIGQAAPFLKDVLPYAAMAAAPFLGPTAAAGLGALGSGFGTTPGAGFNMKRALMGGIASYGLSNIGSGLAEAGMPATAPMSLGSIEEPLVGGALKTTAPNPATTGGFWEQITNAPEKAKLMQQGAGNLMKGGDAFTTAANAFGTKAGMGSAGMAIMGGSGVLGVDEADSQNQAAAGTNSAAEQQRAIQANKRAQAKINAQNAVAANPFSFDMGGVVNPPDDQTGMPNRTPLTRIEPDSSMGYAMGGIANVPRFLSGGGDGMSDSIKANIEGTQEARLADGEFVIPADVVSHLGNGSSKAGAKQLYSMMDRIRQARTGRKAQGREVNPNKFMPA